MLLWIENAPINGETTTKEIETFIHRHCKCSKNEEISELINYQTHRHARTCKHWGKMSVASTFLCHQCQRLRRLNLLMTKKLKKMLIYSRIILRFLNIFMVSKEDIAFEDFLKELEMTFDSYVLVSDQV